MIATSEYACDTGDSGPKVTVLSFLLGSCFLFKRTHRSFLDTYFPLHAGPTLSAQRQSSDAGMLAWLSDGADDETLHPGIVWRTLL